MFVLLCGYGLNVINLKLYLFFTTPRSLKNLKLNNHPTSKLPQGKRCTLIESYPSGELEWQYKDAQIVTILLISMVPQRKL